MLAQIAAADTSVVATSASQTNYGAILAGILVIVGFLWLVFQSRGEKAPAAAPVTPPTPLPTPTPKPRRTPSSKSRPAPIPNPQSALAHTPPPAPGPNSRTPATAAPPVVPASASLSAPIVPPPPVVVIEPPIEQTSQPKYIGYNPINVFAQTEPWAFPYVAMPKPGSVIKFPRKGRVGRKGYKEAHLFAELQRHLATSFQLFDDRFILISTGTSPYEPDITLIDERTGLNLFLDIEVDEPYEGSNDITARRASHYQGADTTRNSAFTRRGWVVVRFAEIQVHQQLLSCCRFVSDVISSVNPSFRTPPTLAQAPTIQPVPLGWSSGHSQLVKTRFFFRSCSNW